MLKNVKVLFFVVIFILILCFCSIVETTYTRHGTVTKKNNQNILITDQSGNIWSYDDFQNIFFVNDKVKLIMDTNNTNHIIIDDKIKKIRKSKGF